LSRVAALRYRLGMTRSTRLVPSTLAALAIPATLALAGCGGGDPFSRIESTYDRMVNDLCSRCPAATGSTTEAECRAAGAANDPFSGAQWDCQRGVYQRYPEELGPYYDCISRSVTSYESCMRTATATCPPTSTSITTCNDQLNAGIEACPRPDSIMATTELSACFAD
jgi:hypothetical protein